MDLSDVLVSMIGFYDNDETGSPWSVILYIDEGANDEQFESSKSDISRTRGR